MLKNYFPAILATIATSGLLPCAFYTIVIVITNDVGGPLNLLAIPLINLLVACVLAVLILLPISLLLPRVLSKISRNHAFLLSGWQRFIGLAGSVIVILAGFGFSIWIALNVSDIYPTNSTLETDPEAIGLFRFAFCGGFPLLASLPFYVFFYHLFRNTEDVTVGSQKERDNQIGL